VVLPPRSTPTALTLWVHLTDMEEGRPVPAPEEAEAFKAKLLQPA
jgi:hypothetical protein